MHPLFLLRFPLGGKLLWFINIILHAFGWVIVIEMENTEVKNVYPARVKFRGYPKHSITNGYIGLSQYMYLNAEELLKELKGK